MKIFEALILGLLVLMASTSSCLGNENDNDQIAKLIVSGSGDASADPDMVTIVLGVETKDESAAAAAEENAELMTETITALTDAGVEEDDIKTTRFSIYPRREWIDGRQSDTVEFVVTNQVAINMDYDEETDVGAILDAAVSAGTNTVNSVTFSLGDRTPLEEEALAEAVANAMGKADAIANASGVKLGSILSLSEAGFGPVPVEDRAFLALESAPGTSIIPGDVEVTASVSITYEIM